MRVIRKIIIHNSATPPEMDIGAADIRRWHTDPPPKGNGWNEVGYHWVIRRDGSLERGRDESIAGAHVAGENQDSIGICLVGGTKRGGNTTPDCNITRHQWRRLEILVAELLERYPGAKVAGHRDYSVKACPGFDVAAWWGA